ncbi:MAG: hypothetical protein NTX50_01315 [Candidatus Sumerlaeota bacterium]|nr:hypothetical protein [Candidatus Sumerlaeota bacterium]
MRVAMILCSIDLWMNANHSMWPANPSEKALHQKNAEKANQYALKMEREKGKEWSQRRVKNSETIESCDYSHKEDC